MTAKPKRQRRTKVQIEQARRRREAGRKANLKARHHMTPEQYDALLAFQDGVCYLCHRKPGKKALSVDHDHAYARAHCEHPHDESCIECWRGLLHDICNRMFGHLRDDPEAFGRGKTYLTNPPAHEWRLSER